MRSGQLTAGKWLAIGLAAAALLWTAPTWAQNNNNNQGGNQGNQGNGGVVVGSLPAGVMVSPDGVLRVKQFADKTGQLAKTRAAEARAKLGAELARPSMLRKISLPRLEAAMAEKLAEGKEPTEEMRFLAGLTRLQYVFYYPDSKEIVVAGPAEGFVPDASGRMVGANTGRAVLELQDLVAAMRAFPAAGKQTHVISVSIDPTQEGLQAMQKWLAEISGSVRSPAQGPAIVEGLKQKLGQHNVTIAGISPRTHFAQVMVEADYRMKLIGIGIEQPPVKMATFISRANPTEVSRNALQRWFFTPNYDCVRVTEDLMAMQLVGDGVQLVGEHELVAADGTRHDAAQGSQASQLYCKAFTELYPQIAARSPVYAQLRNLIDMSVAAAFIQRQDYYGQSGWKADVMLDEGQYPIETYEAPKTVESACTAVMKGNRLMTPIGGGVHIEPTSALQSSRLMKDEKGEVKAAREQLKLDGLAKGQWWWD